MSGDLPRQKRKEKKSCLRWQRIRIRVVVVGHILSYSKLWAFSGVEAERASVSDVEQHARQRELEGLRTGK